MNNKTIHITTSRFITTIDNNIVRIIICKICILSVYMIGYLLKYFTSNIKLNQSV